MNQFRLPGAIAIVAAILGLFASAAGAQEIRNNNGYYFEPATLGGDGKQLDPLSLIWKGGAIHTLMNEANIRDVVERNWNAPTPGGPAPSAGKMTFDQLCLGQRASEVSGTDLGRQRVRFRAEIEHLTNVVHNDYQGSTSSGCNNQWHMRFWDDEPIADRIPGYGSPFQYALSGVHYDIAKGKYCIKPLIGTNKCTFSLNRGGHTVSGRWNAWRTYTIHRKMRHLCGRSHYKRRIGADRDYQGKRFDGWMGIVKFTYDGTNDANCPAGLG